MVFFRVFSGNSVQAPDLVFLVVKVFFVSFLGFGDCSLLSIGAWVSSRLLLSGFRAAIFLPCLLPFCFLLPGYSSSSELWCFCFWHLYGVIGEAMSREGMFTLFVDNLPELVSLHGLRRCSMITG